MSCGICFGTRIATLMAGRSYVRVLFVMNAMQQIPVQMNQPVPTGTSSDGVLAQTGGKPAHTTVPRADVPGSTTGRGVGRGTNNRSNAAKQNSSGKKLHNAVNPAEAMYAAENPAGIQSGEATFLQILTAAGAYSPQGQTTGQPALLVTNGFNYVGKGGENAVELQGAQAGFAPAAAAIKHKLLSVSNAKGSRGQIPGRQLNSAENVLQQTESGRQNLQLNKDFGQGLASLSSHFNGNTAAQGADVNSRRNFILRSLRGQAAKPEGQRTINGNTGNTSLNEPQGLSETLGKLYSFSRPTSDARPQQAADVNNAGRNMPLAGGYEGILTTSATSRSVRVIEGADISGASPTEQVAAGLKISARESGREVVIRLNPPELGSVRVSLKQHGNEVHGKILVDNPETMMHFRRETQNLTHGLAESGINLQRMEVALSGQNSQQPGQGTWQNPDGSGQNGYMGEGSAGARQQNNGGHETQDEPQASNNPTTESQNFNEDNPSTARQSQTAGDGLVNIRM